MANSVRREHPDWHLCAVIADKAPEGVDLSFLSIFDIVLYPWQLGIPSLPSWLFKHDLVEACTAVKGHALVRLLETYDAAVFLDPDVVLFGALDELESLFEQNSIILTPHQTAANCSPRAIGDNEATSMLFGIYNLGFVAVKNSPDGVAFARWWASMLLKACYDDLPSGLFTDQKYCDLVPGLFETVCVLRDPGWNVASWNLSTRTLEICRDGNIRVDGSPLKFFHFSKIDGVGDVMSSLYSKAGSATNEIWEWYRSQIREYQPSWTRHHQWYYSRFDNGVPIDTAARQLYRHREDLIQAFPNPFSSSKGYHDWLKSEGLLQQAM